jgi:hypothetical protein
MSIINRPGFYIRRPVRYRNTRIPANLALLFLLLLFLASDPSFVPADSSHQRVKSWSVRDDSTGCGVDPPTGTLDYFHFTLVTLTRSNFKRQRVEVDTLQAIREQVAFFLRQFCGVHFDRHDGMGAVDSSSQARGLIYFKP